MQATEPINKLYPYQTRDIEAIFDKMQTAQKPCRLLYQLPTGGGKTVVFSEIARLFIERYGLKVAILSHRTELCSQTSTTLKRLGVRNKIIDASTSQIRGNYPCYVAMVETLKNRLKQRKISTAGVGLVIVDEAHHNSFRKLLGRFSGAFVIGVTATPFSADIETPMNACYDCLITGAEIPDLIRKGFLAKPTYYSYPVELNSLVTGSRGDYTVTSSNALYGSEAMLNLLLESYRNQANGKKTLIFNNGIETSKRVAETFEKAGIAVRHLDGRTSSQERRELLQWFRKTKGAVLTSVSVLTTGFDEPSIQAVILNRATTSVTLYHQMVGRGGRPLPNKKTFRVIDLGNNIERFGQWSEPVDWHYVFSKPEEYARSLQYAGNPEGQSTVHHITPALRAMFPKTLELGMYIGEEVQKALADGKKPKAVISHSIRQQALTCLENSDTVSRALELANALEPEINWRVREYVKCIDKPTASYKQWLAEDYKTRLEALIKKLHRRIEHAPEIEV